MSYIRSMPFPQGIHLLPGLAVPPKTPFKPHLNNQDPQKSFKRYDGPVYLPPQIFKLLSQDASKALKSYNTEALNRFHKTKVHNTDVVEIPQDDSPEPSVPDSGHSDLPESDLDIPEDLILNIVNRQCHSPEDLDQALQAYQTYQVLCSQDSTPTPERKINHHYNLPYSSSFTS